MSRAARLALLPLLGLALLLATGCSYLVTIPSVLGEAQEHRRHALLRTGPLDAATTPTLAVAAPDVHIEPFHFVPARRSWFRELWLVPGLPVLDTEYGLLHPVPDSFGATPLAVTIELPPPPPGGLERATPRFTDTVERRLREGVARIPVDSRIGPVFRENLRAQAASPLEFDLAASLREAGFATSTAAEDGALVQRWVLVDPLTPDAIAELLAPHYAGDAAPTTGTVVLLQGRHALLETERLDPPGLPADVVRVSGRVDRFDLQNRRLLWGLTLIGSNALSILGAPQSASRYVLVVRLTATAPDGSVLAERLVDVRTPWRLGGVWYGFQPLADELRAAWRDAVRAEWAAFAGQLREAATRRDFLEGEPAA